MKRKTEEKHVVAHMLFKYKDKITQCDSCDDFVLKEHTHYYKKEKRCPDCDLPEKWSSKFSKKTHRLYFVYFDHKEPGKRYVQWGHPTKGNPLHIAKDSDSESNSVSCWAK
jgi:hypothetical protein